MALHTHRRNRAGFVTYYVRAIVRGIVSPYEGPNLRKGGL